MLKLKNLENSLIFYLLIVFACANVIDRGSVLLMVALLFAIVLQMLRSTKFAADFSMLIVLLFSLVCALFSVADFQFLSAIRSINYFLAYFVGYNALVRADKKDDFIKKLCFSIFLGFFLYVTLIWYKNINISMDSMRIMTDFWNGLPVSATLVSLLCCVVVGYSFYALFLSKGILLKILSALSLTVVALLNLQSATRTPFVMTFVIYAVMFILITVNSKGEKGIGVILLAGLVVTTVFLIYQKNIFGIKSLVETSALFDRVENVGMETGRTEIFTKYWDATFDHLWGGGTLRAEIGSHAHNYLQEAHDIYGVFGSIPLLAITFGVVVNIVRIIILKVKEKIDFLLLSVYLAIFIQICLEPVFEGYPLLFSIFMLIHGVISARLKMQKEFN